jgi:hypothetical protein
MTRYWAVALIVAIVGLLLAVRRIARRPQADEEQHLQVPRGDGERELRELDAPVHAEAFGDDPIDDSGDLDDTAPSVLSPPEWTPPKSASNGSRR